ncbi:MAG: serine/threonine protein kinase [Planctomycetota bacterium]|jgi:serine/threonine protein kinase
MHESDPDDLDPTLHGGDETELGARPGPKPVPTPTSEGEGEGTMIEGTMVSEPDRGEVGERRPSSALGAAPGEGGDGTMLSGTGGPSGAAEAPPHGSQRAEGKAPLEPDQPKGIPLMVNARVGSYRLKKVVGKGAQGSVWHAFNEVAERNFALKFINTELVSAKWAIDGIRSEASVLFDLTHPGIVRLNNIEQVGSHIFLVMEFLGGPSLQGVHKRRLAVDPDGPAFDVGECLWLLERLAPALDYAAAEGITHRDIKPGNVMFTHAFDADDKLMDVESEIKLCDFGIAFVQQQVAEDDEVRPTGTPPYMAPEVIAGARPDHRADIYSMAATLYHLYCGSPPVRGRSLDEILAKLKAGDFKPIDSGNKPFDAAIMRALSFDPDGRQDSFDKFLYEASDRTLGTQAATLGPWPKIIAIGATLLAAGAVTFALDPFGIRRGQAEFLVDPELPTLDGTTVVNGTSSTLAFDYRSPGDEEVGVAVDDQPPVFVRPVESGDDRYEVTVDLPTEGLHKITVSTADGASILGQSNLIVDRSVTLPGNPVKVEGVGSHPQSEPIVVTFRVGEDGVEVQDLGEVPAKVLELNWSERQARYEFVVPSEENDDKWEVTREFLFRDPYGNEAKHSVKFDVYAKQNIVAGLHADFPGATGDLHPWDLAETDAAMKRWKESVQSASIPKGTKRELIAKRQAVMDMASDRIANPPERAIALTLEGGAWKLRDAADGSRDLYTRSRDLVVTGSTEGSRSPEVIATVDGVGITVKRTHSINRDTGAFAVPLSLAPGADGHFRMSLPDSGPVASVRVVLDEDSPSMTLQAPANGSGLSATIAEVVFVIQDEHSGLEEVVLVDPSGAEIPMVMDETGDRWRATAALPSDGEHRLRVRATDGVGNQAQADLTVVRDMQAPEWNGKAATELKPTTGRALSLVWKFDEPVATATASITFSGEDGARLAPAAPEGKPVINGSAVDIEIALPFEPMSAVTVELTVGDALGNERTIKAETSVTHDPWGAVPDFIRNDAVAILDQGELVELLGERLGAKPYVVEGSSRFPRCIRHTGGTGMVFVYVPAGEFQYGPPGNEALVSMSGFYLARTEVSGEQFVAGADIVGYEKGNLESSKLPIRTNRDDAGTWCYRLEFDLPTEAQWEYAASGPRNSKYPWGNERNEALRNGPEKSALATKPKPVEVDGFADGRSWCGAIQMSGNLAELCRDELVPGAVTEARDPKGILTSVRSGSVIRGGSTRTAKDDIETTYGRARMSPNKSTRSPGFRPVWPLSSSR